MKSFHLGFFITAALCCAGCALEDGIVCQLNATKCDDKALMVCANPESFSPWKFKTACDDGCKEKDGAAYCVLKEPTEEEPENTVTEEPPADDPCGGKKFKCDELDETALWQCVNGVWKALDCGDKVCRPKGNLVECVERENPPVCEGENCDKPCEGENCDKPCEGENCKTPEEDKCSSANETCLSDGITRSYCDNGQIKQEKCSNSCVSGNCISFRFSPEKLELESGGNAKMLVIYQLNRQVPQDRELLVQSDNESCFTVNGNRFKTDDGGTITIEVMAAGSGCSGNLVVSDPAIENVSVTAIVQVNGRMDLNGNHMYDNYETFKGSGISCKKHSDCTVNWADGFCDSLMGYICSTRCKSNDECVEGYVCRDDGRCTTDEFITVWDYSSGYGTAGLPTIVAKKCDFDVDWGDGSESEHVDNTICGSQNKMHSYAKAGTYTVKVKGTYDGWQLCINNEDCASAIMEKLTKVSSFGLVGLGPYAFAKTKNVAIDAKDIPDASKLTSLDHMFAMSRFNADISKWDTSNVTSMQAAFYNNTAFNQPLETWDVSNVTTLNDMFNGATAFNQPLDKWDVHSVTSAKNCFWMATQFAQDLTAWQISYTALRGSTIFQHSAVLNDENRLLSCSMIKNNEAFSKYACIDCNFKESKNKDNCKGYGIENMTDFCKSL